MVLHSQLRFASRKLGWGPESSASSTVMHRRSGGAWGMSVDRQLIPWFQVSGNHTLPFGGLRRGHVGGSGSQAAAQLLRGVLGADITRGETRHERLWAKRGRFMLYKRPRPNGQPQLSETVGRQPMHLDIRGSQCTCNACRRRIQSRRRCGGGGAKATQLTRARPETNTIRCSSASLLARIVRPPGLAGELCPYMSFWRGRMMSADFGVACNGMSVADNTGIEELRKNRCAYCIDQGASARRVETLNYSVSNIWLV